MRGYDLTDVCQSGIHEDYQLPAKAEARRAGWGIVLIPWCVMFVIWLVTK